MPGSFVQANKSGNTTGSPQSAVLGSAVSAGNLLVAIVAGTVTATDSIPGFTSVNVSDVGNSTQQATYLQLLAGPGQTSTITTTSSGVPGSYQIAAMEISGVSDVAHQAYTVSKTPTTTTALGLITPTIVTTVPCILIATMATSVSEAIASTTVSSGWNIITAQTVNSRSALAYQIANTPGSYDCTWSWLNLARSTVGIVAYPITLVNGVTFITYRPAWRS